MKNFFSDLIENKKLSIILVLALAIRLLFFFFGAAFYYNSQSFTVQGDTSWWMNNIINLINHGEYTNELNSELGYFTRTPGYSFFLGFIYLIAGRDLNLTYQIVPYIQIFLDVIAVLLVFKITELTFKNIKIALLSSLIYACYPFIIVWNVVAYAESLSVFFMLWGIYLLIINKSWPYFVLSGLVLGIAILTRIQLIVLLPIVILSLAISQYRMEGRLLNLKTFVFALSISLVYGVWPLRNYINHDKVILAQHLGDKYHWSPDIMAFRDYIWSIKVDWDPQFTQIISNQEVVFPKHAYKVEGDSILLQRAVHLMQTCGEGFSHFKRTAKYIDYVVKRGEDCNDEIVDILNTLIYNQKKYNALNYHVVVPLGNLKKAVFKSQLIKQKSGITGMLSKMLFLYRTLLIICGIAGLLILFFKFKSTFLKPAVLIAAIYFVGWYFFISYFYRNMEIRFLLHADILLLFPAAWFIFYVFNKFNTKQLKQSEPTS